MAPIVTANTFTVPDFEDTELNALASEKHALNVQISAYDWQRCIGAAANRGGSTSVSDVVRVALRAWLDGEADAEHIRGQAEIGLKFEQQQRARAAEVEVLSH